MEVNNYCTGKKSVVDGLDGLAELAFKVLPGVCAFITVTLTLRLVVRASFEELLVTSFIGDGSVPGLLL